MRTWTPERPENGHARCFIPTYLQTMFSQGIQMSKILQYEVLGVKDDLYSQHRFSCSSNGYLTEQLA